MNSMGPSYTGVGCPSCLWTARVVVVTVVSGRSSLLPSPSPTHLSHALLMVVVVEPEGRGSASSGAVGPKQRRGGPRPLGGKMLHLFQLSKSLPHTHSLADKAYVVDAPPPFTHTQVGARLSSHVCPQWG